MSRSKLEFGCAEIVIGLPAGVAGASTTLLFHAIEHLTYTTASARCCKA